MEVISYGDALNSICGRPLSIASPDLHKYLAYTPESTNLPLMAEVVLFRSGEFVPEADVRANIERLLQLYPADSQVCTPALMFYILFAVGFALLCVMVFLVYSVCYWCECADGVVVVCLEGMRTVVQRSGRVKCPFVASRNLVAAWPYLG